MDRRSKVVKLAAEEEESEPQSEGLGEEEEGDGDLLLSSDDLDERLGLAAGAAGSEQGAAAVGGVATEDEHKAKKRRRDASQLGNDDDVDEEEDEEEEEGEEGEEKAGQPSVSAVAAVAGKAKLKQRVLSKEGMLRMQEKAERRGVLYVSRIPPHMKPGKLRELLSIHGEVGRLYCAPEDISARRDRKKKGKDTGKNFTEGWVEFEDKRVAKRIAAQLNGQQMGGKKRSAYHFDLWCLKYLSKFKWDHLTEEINYQRAVREQRLAAEISAAKRERDFYLSRVDRAKAMDAMRERRAAKAAAADAQPGQEGAKASGGQRLEGAGAGAAVAGEAKGQKLAAGGDAVKGRELGAAPRMRHFKQRRSKAEGTEADAPMLGDDVLALLGGRR